MSQATPDSILSRTVCARCGTPVEELREASSCPACMASDLGSGEWSDLLSPGGGEMLADGGFTLHEEIGRGGMGIVYRARQRAPERDVALKVLSPSFSTTSDGAQRLIAEAGMMAEMDHAGILPLYASGVQDGRPWLAMKLVDGGTLASRKGAWRGRWRDCAELAADLADAVHHAHERGLIHRDLKPGNILFDKSGRAYVADFGLAKWRDVDSGITHTNMVLGTPAYMAPEVVLADVRAATTASDVYGLGAILYFLLCGQSPFPQAGTLEVLRRIVDEDPAPPRSIVPDVPGDLQVICLKALARQPVTRYSGPDALAADLRRWLAGEPIEARPCTRREKFVRWVRRHPLSAGLSAALIVTVASSGIMLRRQNTALQRLLYEAQHSRDAAYSTLNDAIREWTPQLEAVGRLEDFDHFFAGLESKLKELEKISTSPDSSDLAKRAELYVHWSRVLGWKGLMDQSREKMDSALRMAEQAARLPNAVPHAWMVHSAAHRVLGEFLIDSDDFLNGRPHLDKAGDIIRTGLARFPGDLNLRMEQAELATEIADSYKREHDWGALHTSALEMQRIWNELQPDLAAPGISPFLLQREREKAPYSWYFLGFAARGLKDFDRAIEYYHKLLAIREEQLVKTDSDLLRREMAVAVGWLAESLREADAPIEDVAALHRRGESILASLVEREPKNELYMADYGYAALQMAELSKEERDLQMEWLNKCVSRMAPAGDTRRPEIRNSRSKAFEGLAKYADGGSSAERWNLFLEDAKKRAEIVPARWKQIYEYGDARKVAWTKYFENHEDAAALEARARTWIEEARARAGAPGGSPFWNTVEAGGLRRLADVIRDNYPDRKEEVKNANRRALVLRANLYELSKRHTEDLTDDIESTSTGLLSIEPVLENDARLVLSTMTKLAPAARSWKPNGSWREKWDAPAQTALQALPDVKERERAAQMLHDAFYPLDASEKIAFSPKKDVRHE